MSAPGELLAALVAELGADAVRTEEADLQWYGSDRCKGGWPVAPSAIVLPSSVEAVQAVVRACASRGASIVPSGGRTGLAGGATATSGEIVLSLERLARLHPVDIDGRTVRCEGGATVAAVQAAAIASGLQYPVDWAATGTAHVAGSIATNAGGIRVLRYGLTRRWVRALDVVLANGERLSLGRDVVKDNTGYDLRQLFIGSEGTLGVIVEATLGLTTRPAATIVALCGAARLDQIVSLFKRARADPDLVLSAFECFDHGSVHHVIKHRGRAQGGPFAEPHRQYVLIEVEVERGGADAEARVRDRLQTLLMDSVGAEEIDDALVAANDAQCERVWAWREEISESLHVHTPHKADVSLPMPKLAGFVDRWRELLAEHMPGVEAVCFGHVGDGNLHLNVLRPEGESVAAFVSRCHALDEFVYGLVRDCGGSISAEHGVGLLKRDVLHYSRSASEIAAMRAVKAALDPDAVFNPGKLF